MKAVRVLAAEHLLLRLRPLNRALREAVERQAAEAALLDRPDLTPYCIPDEQAFRMLDRLDALAREVPVRAVPTELTEPERSAERALRDGAHAAGLTLPLDVLAQTFELTAEEQAGLLLCAAPELDRGYERVYAYVLDDLNRRVPSVELLCTLLATSWLERLTLLQTFGPVGRLCRLGLLRPWSEAPTELQMELRCTPGVVCFLTGAPADLTAIGHDPGAVPGLPHGPPSHVDSEVIERVGRAVRAGQVNLIGVWGPRTAGPEDVARAVAEAAGVALRQVPAAALTGPDPAAAVGDALRVASALGAVLWIPVDQLGEYSQRQAVAEVLAQTRAPVCLSGTHPWRPLQALTDRAYAEILVDPPGYRERLAMWTEALPGLERTHAEDLAARYRLTGAELETVGALVRADGYVANGRTPTLNGAVDRAVAAVKYRVSSGPVHAVLPRRTAADLVLPKVQQGQVAEMAAACRAWPKISEVWGFGRHSNGNGVKALFAGEPGTGKTLAAEVIAGTLGMMLLKVDLSRVVSKWVGETEKNLEAAFQQAEESQAVLFFDEADALFGRRGEIKQGVDRYANLEVGFLLQRLEQSDALVILASNLREHIDAAFTRRFHYIINFPRPGPDERQRIWCVAFPSSAPLAVDVDLDAMAALDMTGASISGAARTAALRAADDGSPLITMSHVVQGIRRQYERDARLLRPEEFGRYAALIDGGEQGSHVAPPVKT